MLGAGTFRPVA